MAITKRTEEDKIEIVGPFKMVQVRTATIIEEDGVEISRSSYHNMSFAPNEIHLEESADVKQWLHSFILMQSRDMHTRNIKRITNPINN